MLTHKSTYFSDLSYNSYELLEKLKYFLLPVPTVDKVSVEILTYIRMTQAKGSKYQAP